MRPISFSTLASMLVLAVLMMLLSSTSGAVAQQPAPAGGTIPYSGRLNNDAAQPVEDGMYAFTFVLYDAPEGGNLLWSETQSGVAVEEGAFSVLLGSLTPLPVQRRINQGWLAVSVRGPGEASYTLLTPRQALNTAVSVAPSSPAAGATCAHDHWGESWSGTGNGLELSTYNGDAVRGLTGSYDGVDGEAASGNGVFGITESGRGVYGIGLYYGASGVVAKNENTSGAALEIEQGSFRVAGAGVDTDTTVFIHQAVTGASGNICPAYSGTVTVIDHPLTNGDPYAILIITPNGGTLGAGVGPANPYLFVEYDANNQCGFGQRWVIINNLSAIPNGTKFNVMVIKP